MTHVVSVTQQPAATVTTVDDPTSVDTALTNALISTVVSTSTIGVSPYTIIDQSVGGGDLDGSLAWRLSGTHSVGATTITTKSAPTAVGASQGFVIIDPYTIEAEIRKVTAVGATSFTVSSGLTYAHSDTDPVLWFTSGLVPWTMFGGKGSGSTADATNNVLAFNRLSQQLYNLGTFFRGGIQIPQGNFYINDELTPERDQMIAGVNVMNSKISCTTDFPFDGSDDVAMIHVKRDGTLLSDSFLGSGRWFFRDFFVDGMNVANSNGIMSSPQQPDKTTDVRTDNCKGYGLKLMDVQQHVIQNLEQINCGTGMKFDRGVRMLHCNSWNCENPDLYALHVTSTTGDGNCSRWNKFENLHFETHDDTAGVWMLIDPTNATSPDNSMWVFDYGIVSLRGTETIWKFLGSSIPAGYMIRNWRLYAGGVSTAIDDAWQGKQWMTVGDFNSRIEEFHSAVIGNPSASYPIGNHSIFIRRNLGQEVRIGVPAGTSGQPTSNFYSNVGTQANTNHYEARDSSDTLLFKVGGTGQVTLPLGALLLTRAGSPESALSAPVGSICADVTNGVLYMKKTGTGNTGWKLVTQAA